MLGTWLRAHPEFDVGTNEAGLRLGDDSRGTDAGVWRRIDAGPYTGGIARVPPVLAAEVAGRWEGEAALREKARWYLDHGVAVVWILFPLERQVVVVTRVGESRHGLGEGLPAHPALPGLAPSVGELFWQVSRAE